MMILSILILKRILRKPFRKWEMAVSEMSIQILGIILYVNPVRSLNPFV